MQNDFFLVINGNVKDVRLKLNSQISTTLGERTLLSTSDSIIIK